MRRGRLAALVAIVSAVGLAAFASTAMSTPAPPTASVVKELVGNNPVTCAGGTDVKLTLIGRAGEAGNATDIQLVLDVSGSMAGTKITNLKDAAKAFVSSLDARDGVDDGTLSRSNRVGITTYRGETASTLAGLVNTEASLVTAINGITNTPTGGSPHAEGIIGAQNALAASTVARAIVLITDGLENQDAALAAAIAAKGAPNNIRIATVGIGTGSNSLTGVDPAALQSWATHPSLYQSGTTGFVANKLVDDVGAAVAVPVDFTVTETMGTHFTQSAPVPSVGTTAVLETGTLTWKGILTGAPGVDLHATLGYHATRDVVDVFSVTSETVSTTTTLSVTGGTATISPAGGVLSANLLPCGGAPLDQETCTGAACTASATQGGVQFSVNAGTPSGTTDIFLTGFNQAPPAGVCPGFNTNTNGVQFDIRPLTTDGTFEMVIPKAALLSSGKKWWQTEVCLGTNLRFITKLNSLANLRPGASMIGGGSVPGRWWGVLPSIPRYTLLPKIGLVRGPWVNHRSVRANGDAVIRFIVPYVANSTSLTTDGKPAYDPKAWGG